MPPPTSSGAASAVPGSVSPSPAAGRTPETFREAVVLTLAEEAGFEDAWLVDTVQRFVGSELDALPTHIRIGIEAVAAGLTAMTAMRAGRPLRRLDPQARLSVVRSWGSHPLSPVRQYLRLMRSLVVFAGYELEPSRA